jgi:two-component system, cell cycle response regulator DivK
MEDLQLFPHCELQLGSVVNGQHSIATRPLILAVDDDEDNLLLIAYALEPLGCCLFTATDGKSALSIAQTYQPDLILLDILIPYMDGTEVVSRLRKDSKTKTIPVVAVTALARPEDRDRFLQAGCNDHLTKPYMLEEIEAIVQRYLRLPASIS